MRFLPLLFAAAVAAPMAAAQTIQTITREQSHIVLDIKGFERASESYRYFQATDYSSETYVTARWLPRDTMFAVGRIWELAPNYTFRPSARGIDAGWVHSHLPKFKERQLTFEPPLVDTEKLKLTRFVAEPHACLAFESIAGDIGVRSDSSTGTRHATVSGVVCSQTVKRLTDQDVSDILNGVRMVVPNGGAPQPAFNTTEVLALIRR
jgi:hypothetical protein